MAFAAAKPTRGEAVSVFASWGPIKMTVEQYDMVGERLPDAPDGRELHIASGDDGAMYVAEIWDSEEQAEAFSRSLLPVLEDVGIEPVWGDVHEVRRVIRR
jgi:hypothetical protein